MLAISIHRMVGFKIHMSVSFEFLCPLNLERWRNQLLQKDGKSFPCHEVGRGPTREAVAVAAVLRVVLFAALMGLSFLLGDKRRLDQPSRRSTNL